MALAGEEADARQSAHKRSRRTRHRPLPSPATGAAPAAKLPLLVDLLEARSRTEPRPARPRPTASGSAPEEKCHGDRVDGSGARSDDGCGGGKDGGSGLQPAERVVEAQGRAPWVVVDDNCRESAELPKERHEEEKRSGGQPMRVGRGVRVASKCHLQGGLKLLGKKHEQEESQGDGGEGWMPWRLTGSHATILVAVQR